MEQTSPNGCSNCQLLQQELDITRRLVAAEQHSDQMKSDLIHAYDQLLTRIGADKRSVAQKAIDIYANYNKLQKLRAELKQWQKLHKPLSQPSKEPKNPMISDQPLKVPKKEPIDLEEVERPSISCQTRTLVTALDSRTILTDISPHISETIPKLMDIQQNIPKLTDIQPKVVSTERPIPQSSKPETIPNQNPISVQLELIPKVECISDDECVIIEGVEPPDSPEKSVPTPLPTEFMFASHLLTKMSMEDSQEGDRPATDKAVAIDLNESDDTSGPTATRSSLFNDDSIVDLTPNKNKKKVPSKNKKKVQKKKLVKTKKKLDQSKKKTSSNSKTVSVSSRSGTSLTIEKTGQHLRVIESNRKKIRINSDNTITILDVTPSSGKSSSDSTKKSSKTVDMDNLTPIQKSKILNENIIKKNKNKIVLKGNMYYCKYGVCEYTTEVRSRAVRHLWTHTGELPFSCKICGLGFRDKPRLWSHVMTHNTNGHCVCPACDKSYKDFASLMKHVKNSHGLEKYERWRNDYYRQKKLLGPTIKLKAETSNKPIVPKPVKKSPVKVVRTPVQVSRTPVTTDLEEWTCDYPNCHLSYSAKHNLKRHQMEAHKKLSRPLFKNSLNKTGKVIKFFIPKTDTSPPSPTKGRSSHSVSSSHVKTVSTAVSDKKFLCVQCSKDFLSLSGLYKHKKKFHSGRGQAVTSKSSDKNKPWTCDQCPARYHCKGTLAKHMNSEHKTEETEEVTTEDKGDYPCPYQDCQFVANTCRTQLIHWKAHFSDEDKPFKCLISGCSYSNKELKNLKYHVWNRHSEQQFFRAMEETGIHYPIWY